MLLTVDFTSLAAFQALAPADDLAIVSIGNPAEMPPRQLDAHRVSLRVEFLDCDLSEADARGYPLEALCTPQHIEQLTQFIAGLHTSEKQWRLVVHCHQGSSRSAAVALIARAMTGCSMPRAAEAGSANQHVLQVATAALGRSLA